MKFSEQAEGRVDRVLEVLNSRGVGFETGNDRFASVEEASKLLQAAYRTDATVSTVALRELKRLRAALLELLESGWTNHAAHAELNAIAAATGFTLVFHNTSEVELATQEARDFRAMILRDIAGLVEAGQWIRLKNCSNKACSATFFDGSRNRTQRWHSFEVCGNKHNVAAFRARLG